MSSPFQYRRWLRPAVDAAPATWWSGETAGGFDIRSLLPGRYPAYARLFHPARLEWDGRQHEVRWTDLCQQNGRVAHPAMQWEAVTRTPAGNGSGWTEEPRMGSLPERLADTLAAILNRHTATADRCWFGVWTGYGALKLPAGTPTFEIDRRSMALFSGPLTAVTESFEPPPWEQHANLWWPDDRAWCVATDIDLRTTYIGGSEACVQDILADAGLEAMAVPPTQRITLDSDTINASAR